MIEIPDRFPLPRDAFERQRSLLGTYVAGRQQSSRRTLREVAAVAAVVMVGGLLVTPALGIGSRLLDLIQDNPPLRETREAAWSPDGRKISYVSRSDRNTWGLYVINVDGSGERMLTSVLSTSTSWSPDGRKIAFRGPRRMPDASHPHPASGLWVINTDGSGKRRLAHRGSDPDWSPDGGRIAFAASSKIYVVNADGTGQRRLAGNGRLSSPVWSPDGRKIAFLSTAGTACDFCFHVYVVNADGSGERRLTHNPTPGSARSGPILGNFSPAWSPDGQRIAFVQRHFDPTGPDVGWVWVMSADGREQRKLTGETSLAEGRFARLSWSPDGRRLAFTSDRDGNAEVFTINSEGGGLRRLTNNPEYDGDAAWSPNGRQLVFVSNRDGSHGVYIMNADGSGQRTLTQPDG
jgi:Tol biopolymer transport system component